MQFGAVKWFYAIKGFGFIQPDAGGATPSSKSARSNGRASARSMKAKKSVTNWSAASAAERCPRANSARPRQGLDAAFQRLLDRSDSRGRPSERTGTCEIHMATSARSPRGTGCNGLQTLER